MPFPNIQRPLYGVSVTVTNTAQTLLALIQAVTSPANFYTNVQGSARSYSLQLDPNAGDIFLGDENVSSTNCGLQMSAGGGFLDRASVPGMAPIGAVWAVTLAATSRLNIFIFPE